MWIDIYCEISYLHNLVIICIMLKLTVQILTCYNMSFLMNLAYHM